MSRRIRVSLWWVVCASVVFFGHAPRSALAAVTPGVLVCNAAAPELVVHAPTAYGEDPSSYQYIFWRAHFLRRNGSAWEDVASGPWLISLAYPSTPTQYWWDYTSGAYAGDSASVQQTYSVGGGGTWTVVGEVHRFSSSGAYVDSATVVGEPVGANAGGGYCSWSAPDEPDTGGDVYALGDDVVSKEAAVTALEAAMASYVEAPELTLTPEEQESGAWVRHGTLEAERRVPYRGSNLVVRFKDSYSAAKPWDTSAVIRSGESHSAWYGLDPWNATRIVHVDTLTGHGFKVDVSTSGFGAMVSSDTVEMRITRRRGWNVNNYYRGIRWEGFLTSIEHRLSATYEFEYGDRQDSLSAFAQDGASI